MRKAEKRRLGEERAKVYLAEEQERMQAVLKLEKKIRAKKAQEDQERKNHRQRKTRELVSDMLREN